MKLISKLKNFVRRQYLLYQLYRASVIANRRQQETGLVHFVVPALNGDLLVVTRSQYRRLVTKGKARYVSSAQLYQGCYYCTRWYSKDNPTPEEVVRRKKRIFLATHGL